MRNPNMPSWAHRDIFTGQFTTEIGGVKYLVDEHGNVDRDHPIFDPPATSASVRAHTNTLAKSYDDLGTNGHATSSQILMAGDAAMRAASAVQRTEHL